LKCGRDYLQWRVGTGTARGETGTVLLKRLSGKPFRRLGRHFEPHCLRIGQRGVAVEVFNVRVEVLLAGHTIHELDGWRNKGLASDSGGQAGADAAQESRFRV